jgi:hypothetical protein
MQPTSPYQTTDIGQECFGNENAAHPNYCGEVVRDCVYKKETENNVWRNCETQNLSLAKLISFSRPDRGKSGVS